MKKILVATALFATMSFAAKDSTAAAKPMMPRDTTKHVEFAKPDSVKKPEFKRDSLKLPVLPDSVKAKLEAMKKDFDSTKTHMGTKDSAKKIAVDSLRKSWEAKRDSQVTHIKNDSTRAKVQARIEKIGEHKAAIKAKVDARKAKIEAKKAVKPEAPAAK